MHFGLIRISIKEGKGVRRVRRVRRALITFAASASLALSAFASAAATCATWHTGEIVSCMWERVIPMPRQHNATLA